MACALRQQANRGKFGLALSGIVATVVVFGSATVWAAEPKTETKAEAKSESKDAKGGKGDAVIESELRKALIGKSALTGELLMKTGDESKPAPEKSPAAAPTRTKDAKEGKDAKEAKEPKSAGAAVGKKMPMPGSETPSAKPAEENAHSAAAHPPAAMPAAASVGKKQH